MRVLAISTSFSHHGTESGYKQILKYIKPVLTVGLDELLTSKPRRLLGTYQFLYEFVAYFKNPKADILHILYGENYFRFSTWLFKIPIVVTFHQPAETLRFELEKGAFAGRIAGYAHRLNRGRFRKVSAAIVTNSDQKKVLRDFIDEKKIFVIPLGIHLAESNRLFKELRQSTDPTPESYVIVLGNWLRNWTLLSDVLEIMGTEKPDLNFILVNKKLDETHREKLSKYSNLEIKKEVDREGLLKLLYFAKLHFMPLESAAGNNALIEGLSMGCPAIISLQGEDVVHINEAVVKYRKADARLLVREMLSDLVYQSEDKKRLACNNYAQQFDWKEIANQTESVYNLVV
ncbi:MAG: hypothetical protein CL840_05935 [Crocinitomicaceae bacterium]|nr:hypothetical protein [Crocinitomicaceae bacterium]|tara:strand:+ start:133 stop:1170 length:1038 start_codon:yes stop_codon:yes gene_type:complete